jgi:amino acid adenylation domain-containing protein
MNDTTQKNIDLKPGQEKEYWLDRLSGKNEGAAVNIRLDFHRLPQYSEKQEELSMPFDTEVTQQLKQLTGDDPFLVYTVLLTILNICLYKYTATSTLVLGSPALLPLDGGAPVTNALTLISELDDTSSFRDFLMKVRETLLETYERQQYPYENLLEDLELKQIENRCPLFDIAAVFDEIHGPLPNNLRNDLTLAFYRQQDNLEVQARFNARLYRDGAIQRFLGHYQHLLKDALADTAAPISQLQPLDEIERHKLLVEWNDSQHDFPRHKCNHQLFEEYAQRQPDAPCLFYAGRSLSYRELDEQANQLAHHLQSLGVAPNVLVGICVERSLELVIGLLGVLKAGGAYVPLDPAYPKERLAAMLEDAEMLRVLLTKEHLLEHLPPHSSHTLCLDRDWHNIDAQPKEPPPFTATVEHLVYVIFTSGSTGRPKGAAVQHRGWTNLMHWFDTEFDLSPQDKVLIVSSFSFDITQRSLIMPLIRGAQLHLLASNHYDPGLILETISSQKITIMNCSPSTFYPLVESRDPQLFEKFASLRQLILGGESISASRLRHWVEDERCNTAVANVYGAAECTDVSSFYKLTDYQRYVETSVPAGYPIFNSRVYVLDKYLDPVPQGAPGEICLAGEGVGRGYINDKILTAEKYVPDPFAQKPGEMLYRSGDLGRFMPDGNLEFIGRVDHQVKVRGFRVDLGDIETTLRQHETVKEAVVVDHQFGHGDQRLVAYWVRTPNQNESKSEDNTNIVDHLKTFLKTKLPEYMVPSSFVKMDEIPLSPNGKVDRSALPQPQAIQTDETSTIEAPRNPLENDLASIFAEYLKIPRIGIDENFFELGGHSLLATQVISRVNELYNVRLTQTDLLIDPTVTGLAGRLESAGERL